MSMADTLRDAGSSSIFWFALAIILVLAIAGYFLARRANAHSTAIGDGAKVVQDWVPTGRIDFAGPSMDATNADTPASFYFTSRRYSPSC
jgi:LPXTG-motif cell wall-anchored protein